MSDDRHEGGCQCGQLRFRTIGQPSRAAVCHCRYCQARTGSAFGVSVYFDLGNVEILQGQMKDYSFVTESGRDFTTHFCPDCGTNVMWTLEVFPGLRGVAGGSFDPPTFWFDIPREVFARGKAPFVTLCLEESFETSPSYAPASAGGDERSRSDSARQKTRAPGAISASGKS